MFLYKQKQYFSNFISNSQFYLAVFFQKPVRLVFFWCVYDALFSAMFTLLCFHLSTRNQRWQMQKVIAEFQMQSKLPIQEVKHK